MILSWEMFLSGNGRRFRMTLANLPKKSYPTSTEGLVRLGMDEELAASLKAWMAEQGLPERLGVCVFIEAYARCERMESYVGKMALRNYLMRQKVDPALREACFQWTKGALAAANTPSSKLSA